MDHHVDEVQCSMVISLGCTLFCSEADVAGDPGQAVVRVGQQAAGGGVPGGRGVPATQVDMVARRQEETVARRGECRWRKSASLFIRSVARFLR